jgi:hypothetical protein
MSANSRVVQKEVYGLANCRSKAGLFLPGKDQNNSNIYLARTKDISTFEPV